MNEWFIWTKQRISKLDTQVQEHRHVPEKKTDKDITKFAEWSSKTNSSQFTWRRAEFKQTALTISYDKLFHTRSAFRAKLNLRTSSRQPRSDRTQQRSQLVYFMVTIVTVIVNELRAKCETRSCDVCHTHNKNASTGLQRYDCLMMFYCLEPTFTPPLTTIPTPPHIALNVPPPYSHP